MPAALRRAGLGGYKMGRQQIIFPAKICSDPSGYQFLSWLSLQLHTAFSTEFTFDFSKVSWLEANLCAILGAIISKAEENLCEIQIINLHPKVQDILERNDFLTYYSTRIRMDGKGTIVAFKKFKVTDESGFRSYLDRDLLSMPDLPRMSPQARKKILESIFELFNNAVIHANCTFVFSCGQYFPIKKELKFTVVDLGNSIHQNVSNYLRKSISSSEAIHWAVQEGQTTKNGPIPGGLGLSIIRTFLHMNGGDIQIVSGSGYWKEFKGQIYKEEFPHYFHGTIVNLEFNMNDLASYVVKSEIQNTPIF